MLVLSTMDAPSDLNFIISGQPSMKKLLGLFPTGKELTLEEWIYYGGILISESVVSDDWR